MTELQRSVVVRSRRPTSVASTLDCFSLVE